MIYLPTLIYYLYFVHRIILYKINYKLNGHILKLSNALHAFILSNAFQIVVWNSTTQPTTHYNYYNSMTLNCNV